MTDGMKERAHELGRLLGQSDEYKALARARQRLTEDTASVESMTRLDALERSCSRRRSTRDSSRHSRTSTRSWPG